MNQVSADHQCPFLLEVSNVTIPGIACPLPDVSSLSPPGLFLITLWPSVLSFAVPLVSGTVWGTEWTASDYPESEEQACE